MGNGYFIVGNDGFIMGNGCFIVGNDENGGAYIGKWLFYSGKRVKNSEKGSKT